jgi:hypothetical protein
MAERGRCDCGMNIRDSQMSITCHPSSIGPETWKIAPLFGFAPLPMANVNRCSDYLPGPRTRGNLDKMSRATTPTAFPAGTASASAIAVTLVITT